MTRTVLITLGRLPKGLELARALAGAGCRVIIAEPHRWHLSRVSRSVARSLRVTAPNTDLEAYLDDLATIVRRERVDMVVPVSDETMYVAGLHHRLPAGVVLKCPPADVLLRLHDKLAFVRLAERHGLAVPQTHSAGTAAASDLLARSRCVLKPRLSSAGVGLRVLAPGEAPAPDPAVTPDPAGDGAIAQAFVPGDELSTFSIAAAGRVIGTVVYRALILSGTVAVCFERLEAPPAALLAWVERFAAATAHDGFLSFDFRLDEAGRPLAIECNPRTTSGIHFLTPDSLASAVLEPHRTTQFAFRRERVLQQFYPSLTELQLDAFAGRPVSDRLPWLFRARDVCWSPADPLPLLLMPVVSFEILGRSIFRGETFGEASTVDIAWHGEPAAPPAANAP